MLYMQIEQAITAMVESFLPRFSSEKIGLLVTLDLRDNDYGYAKDGNTRVREEKSACTTISFIFYRPSNYTKVLVHYEFNNGLQPYETDPKCNEVFFEQHSDHDSCWRSDGMRILSKHWRNVERYFGMSPNDVSQFYSFSSFAEPQFIEFEKFEAVRGKKYNHTIGYNVKSKRRIPMNEISNYMDKEV